MPEVWQGDGALAERHSQTHFALQAVQAVDISVDVLLGPPIPLLPPEVLAAGDEGLAGAEVEGEATLPAVQESVVYDVSAPDIVGETLDVWVTFYLCPPYCGAMANGNTVFDGAAACGYELSLGQRFRILNDPTGREYVCEDRGAGPDAWVDIFFADEAAGWAWQGRVGSWATIEMLE